MWRCCCRSVPARVGTTSLPAPCERPAPAGRSTGRWLGLGWIGLGALATLALLWWCCRAVPVFGEDEAHLAVVANWSSPWPAFGFDLQPPRPLQWTLLWSLQTWAARSPAMARLPAFALQSAAIVLVLLWLRRLRVSRWPTAFAVGLLLAAPTQVNLVWLVAVTYPLRAIATLLAAMACWRHAQQPRPVTGLLMLLAFVVALLAHEGGIALLLPLLLAGGLLHGTDGWRRARRDPWTWLLLVSACWRTAEILWWRPGAFYGVRSAGAIAANAVRAVLDYLPYAVREPWLDLLRGTHGCLPQALGLAAFAAVVVLLVLWFCRAAPVERFCLLIVATEPLPAVLSVGLDVRYLEVAMPFFAVAVACALQRTGAPTGRWLQAASAVLLLGWTIDSMAVVGTIRRAGSALLQITELVRMARDHADLDATIVVADLPEFFGDRDVPF